MANGIKQHIIMSDVANVFKKMAKKMNWKVAKIYDSYNLMTDMTVSVENNTYYINISTSNWNSGVSMYICFATQKFDKNNFGSSRIRLKGKLVPEWEMPCEFNDVEQVDEYIEIFTKFIAKKNANFNKNANKTKTNFDEQRITYKSFYDKMEELANKHNVKFSEDKDELKKWEFDGCVISWCHKLKVWRVVLSYMNYSYYKCEKLDDVYDLMDWYEKMPKAPKLSYKF